VNYRALLALVISVSLLTACGGGGGSTPGGGGGGGGNGGGGSSGTLSASGGTIALPTSGGISPTLTYPSSNIPSGVKVTFTAAGSGPTPFSNARHTASGTASAIYTMTFGGNASGQSVTFNGNLTLSYSGTSSNLILEIFDTTQINNASFTNPVATCPETSSSGTVTFTCSGSVSISSLSDAFALEIVSGSNLVSANAFTCPTSDSTSSVARGAVSASEATRHNLTRVRPSMKNVGGQIAVVYNRASFQRSTASFTRSEQSAGTTLSHTFDYPNLGKTIHVLAVPAAQSAAAIAALRSQPGVLSVATTQRRYSLTSSALIVNNHYFGGFAPSNVAPYYEGSALPGQWDMHAIGMEHVFGYSQASGNGAPGGANAAALGTHNAKIAIIDTGEDTTHPDLTANIIYQKCFITPVDSNGDPTGSQSTSNFTTDPFGHGTDVSGIAAAVTDPASIPATTNGFAGAGGNSGIMAYRVFPTPDDTCEQSNGGDNQCGASTTDIAAAIDDAVTNGAMVISMSLGGGGCSGGNDTDAAEGAAVENAISHNVIVVAASGNESASSVDAPGCDTGVIAVGATSLDDGSPNGTGAGGNAVPAGTPSAPSEYVASYSNFGSTNTLHSAASWGIVAPGGDPASDVDDDDLHWIENIWTSTPYMSNSNDTDYAGECTDDYPNSSGTTAPVDCRTLIAGTSMSTPHVAGVAALICGLNPADCNPTAMKTLLCTTADTLNSTHQGCGRLNAYRAVAMALSDPSLP
jgi:subtilisin family serine protease